LFVRSVWLGTHWLCYHEAMIVVTAGKPYIDIDAYACCVAYAELLNLSGTPATATSTAVWNESITASLRALQAPFATNYHSAPEDRFVLVDVSYPSQLDTFVDEQNVIEVFDHHAGYETYWADRLGDASHIEFIGAAATLIYEAWARAGMIDKMSNESAQLLAAAILDNTLNFKARVTTLRDHAAYAFLARYANLDERWAARYFTDCQMTILADVPTALRNDTKFLTFSGLDGELGLGQLVVWDAKDLLAHQREVIASTLGALRPLWLANVVSISEGRSYFVSNNKRVQSWAQRLLDVTFTGDVATADILWLRKEIVKRDKERMRQA